MKRFTVTFLCISLYSPLCWSDTGMGVAGIYTLVSCNSLFTNTAQEKGNRRKRTSNRARTPDLQYFVESVGPGFELGRWTFFSCCLSPEQCLRRGYYNISTCSQKIWTNTCQLLLPSCYGWKRLLPLVWICNIPYMGIYEKMCITDGPYWWFKLHNVTTPSQRYCVLCDIKKIREEWLGSMQWVSGR